MNSPDATIAPIIVRTGPVLLFGGPYGNLQATTALLHEAARRGIPPDHMVCTGDTVAYGADPAACVALLRTARIPAVAGNCEEQLAANAPGCGCGFAPGSACDRASATWFAHADAALDHDGRAWMRTLPAAIELHLGPHRLLVLHGGLDRSNRFVWPSDAAEQDRQLALSGFDGVVAGHCGLPFTRARAGRLWHNPGVIGLPANDGTQRTWFSVLTPEPAGLRIEHHALVYDAPAAAAAMRAAALPEGYAAALDTGLWPDCEILPAAERAARGTPIDPARLVWSGQDTAWPPPTPPRPRFTDPQVTATGEPRAAVPLIGLRTLWFNTGTLCNVACAGCYIESSPSNDRLAYLTRAEMREFLAEAATNHPELHEVGFTGGEPFMNRDMPGMAEDVLRAGHHLLILTNAMRPMQRFAASLLALHAAHPGRMTLRVSLDHHTQARHEAVRGPGTWAPAMAGLRWLADHGFAVAVAGRTLWDEDEPSLRRGYRALFAGLGLRLDADDPARLVLFPEMDARATVPEITDACWAILGKRPSDIMCASSRMVVKRRGAARPAVVSCTLLPYDERFELGATLAEAAAPIRLNHRFCAEFCVLGGGSCSP